MQVSVTIESGHGAGETRSFEQPIVRIGRGSDNDWVLPDTERELSRRHLQLENQIGRVMVRDLSGAGTFVNEEERPIGRDRTHHLHDADRLRLGPYILRVRYAEPSKAGRDPVTDETQGLGPFARPTQVDAGRAAAIFDATWLQAQGTPGPGHHPLGEDAEHREGPMHIPTGQRVVPPAPKRRRVTAHDLFEMGGAADGGEPSLEAVLPPSFEATASTSLEELHPSTPAARAGDEQVAAEPSLPAVTGADRDSRVLQALLEGARIEPGSLTISDEADFAHLVGRQLRELAYGLVVLLQARSAAKGAMRADRTQIGADANNPLKYSATPDDAVRAILSHRGDGYLSPEPAVRDAITEVKQHELALFASIQDAVHALLQAFEPERFERNLDDGKRVARLFGGNRDARCWQEFKARYAKLATEGEKRFLGQIGDQFASAYERHTKGLSGGS